MRTTVFAIRQTRAQIVNVGRNHWVLLDSAQAVIVYDSLRPYHGHFSAHLKQMANELFNCANLRVCQQQLNDYDCGVHALINYEAVSRGVNPGTVYFTDALRISRELQAVLQTNTVQQFSTSGSSE